MKILQISSEVNSGSVGRIAEQIGEQVLAHGGKSYIAYARNSQPSKSKIIKIGTNLDIIMHGLLTRITDRHGFGSKNATLALINEIKKLEPDLIQLQHMHGYFINIEILFKFLAESKIPVVWTFHDCWSFTGHCAYYDFVSCIKWQTHCFECPQINEYPKSFIDNSKKNFFDKRKIFKSVNNLTIVPVSHWLGAETKKSFFKDNTIKVIQNGIDLQKFFIQDNSLIIRKKYNIENKFLVLGVASPWSDRKGLKYFIELGKRLDSSYQIMLIGLSKGQIKTLPENIIGLERTESTNELAEFYSAADVFVNPTLEEALGLTNIEALACGTPVITFNSGGSPETIDERTGVVVDKGDVAGLQNAIYEMRQNSKEYYQIECRRRAELYFNKDKCFHKYIELYKDILNLK